MKRKKTERITGEESLGIRYCFLRRIAAKLIINGHEMPCYITEMDIKHSPDRIESAILELHVARK